MDEWKWDPELEGYRRELTNNSELQMFVDYNKSNPRPVGIWKVWFDFCENRMDLALIGFYASIGAANEAIRKWAEEYESNRNRGYLEFDEI